MVRVVSLGQTDCYSFLITLDPLPVPCGGTLSLFFSFSFLSTNFNAYWLAWLVSSFSNVTSSTHQNNNTIPPFLSLNPTFLCLYCILLLFSLFASFNPCATLFLSLKNITRYIFIKYYACIYVFSFICLQTSPY